MVLIETASSQPTISPWWTILSSIGSLLAAIGALWAAWVSRSSVREMKLERAEDRKRAEPELALTSVSIWSEEDNNPDNASFTYKMIIGNLRENKLFESSALVFVQYKDKNGNDNWHYSIIDRRRYSGEAINTLTVGCNVRGNDFKHDRLNRGVGLVSVVDVYGNEKKFIAYAVHTEEAVRGAQNMEINWESVSLYKNSSTNQKIGQSGLCSLDIELENRTKKAILDLVKKPENGLIKKYVESFLK